MPPSVVSTLAEPPHSAGVEDMMKVRFLQAFVILWMGAAGYKVAPFVGEPAAPLSLGLNRSNESQQTKAPWNQRGCACRLSCPQRRIQWATQYT